MEEVKRGVVGSSIHFCRLHEPLIGPQRHQLNVYELHDSDSHLKAYAQAPPTGEEYDADGTSLSLLRSSKFQQVLLSPSI